jgi:leucyl-tRNA synthetase
MKKSNKTSPKNDIYDHSKIEKKWQKIWASKKTFKTEDTSSKPKFYVLDMFPYPSGEGLHVGHPRGYIATDIYSRFKKMKGFNVLHPMGWDAFGLPAEQYAIKMKINPEIAVKKNVARFKKQISIMGLNYDWSREINTTDPKYYKWTQWIFLQLFKKGLAYESYEPINWCPSCKTGLANEDVEDGKCERCGTVVEKKPMRQWVLKIRDYADRLLNDLDELNWPDHIKELQRNWIGRSEGATLWFNVKNSEEKIYVFTTRPDTLFGVTYVVLAPENKLIEKLKSQITNWKEVEDYIKKSKNKSEIERTDETKEKNGVELKGVVVKHPITKEIIPAFISDYVLGHYGTGAVMAVPAHDDRDFAFAKKYNLPIREVISGGNISEKAYTGSGVLINSGKLDGMKNEEAKKEITEAAGGEMTKNYKLQNWVFSRQRYWGEPIPVVHCEKCGVVAVPEKDLPLKLPKVKSYEPTGTGESPLAAIEKWVNTKCPKCVGKAKRETNTMPQWAGSSWYYLRYIDPKNNKALVDPKKEAYWMGAGLPRSESSLRDSGAGVDMYVGGAEHATRHLIYARFWHKFLYDIGVVSTKEPFKQYRNPGMILGSDTRKMSKRWGNVVNPDEVVKNVGADTLRVYESFMGPFEQEISWSTDSMVGSRRFLERVWNLQKKVDVKVLDDSDTLALLHKAIKKVGEDITTFNANTAVSAMMILVNYLEAKEKIGKETFESFVKILSPFAPHICEEVWANLGNKNLLALESWPKYDESKIKSAKIKMPVQINGKVRATLDIDIDTEQIEVERLALKQSEIVKWLEGKNIKKKIFVRNKIINFVV